MNVLHSAFSSSGARRSSGDRLTSRMGGLVVRWGRGPRGALPWLLAFATGSSAGCGEKVVEIPDAAVIDAGEDVPDNCTAASSCTLADGMSASDYVSPAGDEDAWAIAVPASGQVIHVLVTNDADFSPIRLEVVLFGPGGQGAALENARFQGNGKQRVEIQLVAPEPGSYRVVVRDAGNDAADRRNPYFITVTLLSQTDTNEPNDAPGEASLLTPGTAASGTIGSQGDQDWFSVDVAANKLVDISLSAPNAMTSSVRLKYELWSPAGDTKIAEATEPGGAASALRENRAVGNMPGRYLIKVIDDETDGRDADLSRVYLLRVALVDEPDAQDLRAPNETSADATLVTSGQVVTGYIAAKSDLDYFAVQIDGASMTTPRLIAVEASMASTSPVDLSIRVLNPDGMSEVCDPDPECKALRFVGDGSQRPARVATSHNVWAPGRYLVVVRDHQDNDYDTGVTYTVRIDLPPEPDTNERYEGDREDGRVVLSTTSTTGTTIEYPWVEGYISYAGDVDWYVFNVPGSMGASLGQNGDWRVQLELQKASPTAVELEAFFVAEGRFGFSKGYGQRCRMPMQGDPDPTGCQYADDQNGINLVAGEGPVRNADCLVVFREHTNAGPLYFRFTDLNRDDYDLRPGGGAYRFRVMFTAGCPASSLCAGMYTDTDGATDLCGGRP